MVTLLAPENEGLRTGVRDRSWLDRLRLTYASSSSAALCLSSSSPASVSAGVWTAGEPYALESVVVVPELPVVSSRPRAVLEEEVLDAAPGSLRRACEANSAASSSEMADGFFWCETAVATLRDDLKLNLGRGANEARAWASFSLSAFMACQNVSIASWAV
ncbi:hypothetical protein BC567DRAFT_216559 [Phyllosticta citribraziliensis]